MREREQKPYYGPGFCDACHKPLRKHPKPEDVCEDLINARMALAQAATMLHIDGDMVVGDAGYPSIPVEEVPELASFLKEFVATAQEDHA